MDSWVTESTALRHLQCGLETRSEFHSQKFLDFRQNLQHIQLCDRIFQRKFSQTGVSYDGILYRDRRITWNFHLRLTDLLLLFYRAHLKVFHRFRRYTVLCHHRPSLRVYSCPVLRIYNNLKVIKFHGHFSTANVRFNLIKKNHNSIRNNCS